MTTARTSTLTPAELDACLAKGRHARADAFAALWQALMRRIERFRHSGRNGGTMSRPQTPAHC